MQDIMKARKKDAPVKPPAKIDARPGDFDLPPSLYLECDIFKRLKVKPNPDKFPGTLVLRKFEVSDTLCRQGDPGWTAFAILSTKDIVAMAAGRDKLLETLPDQIKKNEQKQKEKEKAKEAVEKEQADKGPTEKSRSLIKSLEEEIERAVEQLEKDKKLLARLRTATLPTPIPPAPADPVDLGDGDADDDRGVLPTPSPPAPADPANVVGVYLDASSGSQRSRGWLSRLFAAKKSSRQPNKGISIDGPTPIDPRTRKAAMKEGSLFGEWSCIYGTPRSATIIAERDCYVLEMLRNVLDKILGDEDFQKSADKEYRQNVLQNHLAGLPFFAELTPEQFAIIREGVELKRYKDGEVIFKRGDEPTAIYIVRRGIVKVLVEDPAGESVLRYLTQGDFFGEMGVKDKKPRTATCVAYVHPAPAADEVDKQGDKWRKEEQRVELVEIPAPLFDQLLKADSTFKSKVESVIKSHKERDESRKKVSGPKDGTPGRESDDFQKLGLIQGQKLMLIDLDRCTRCDECVQACISTHSDGRTRLFLDGPRFGQYLVPTTCRSCRDPVCLIGCPVSSIRRGDNLQIVIEDWCIGCQLCAKSCPYGSIQMHDLGLIREQAHGWKFLHAAAVAGDSWTGPGIDDRLWIPGATPFLWDRDMEALVPPDSAEPAFVFRYTFPIEAGLLKDPEAAFKLSLDSDAQEVVVEGKGRSAKIAGLIDVWLNGEKLSLGKWAIQNEQFVFELAGETRGLLRPGKNVIAARATGVPGKRGVLLQVALDEVRPSGAVLPQAAVVCDQCSTLPGQMQACVHACPHDAAKRVDAWTAFPTR